MKPLRSPKSGDVTIVMGVIFLLSGCYQKKTFPKKDVETCFPDGSSMTFPLSFPGFQLFYLWLGATSTPMASPGQMPSRSPLRSLRITNKHGSVGTVVLEAWWWLCYCGGPLDSSMDVLRF